MVTHQDSSHRLKRYRESPFTEYKIVPRDSPTTQFELSHSRV